MNIFLENVHIRQMQLKSKGKKSSMARSLPVENLFF